uniref:Mce/MlaD domain-containing protein n=1 Tax=Trichogloeopsis pedicellata TaxID=1495610 RepID=A0A1G4P0D0_9FLOR|nr:Hypothetical protein ycf22 [Trichogloeopsis pedicellata]SCW24365.1 Hypothetical protein ycf22 [Trichogloeopsis pedicellata]
MKILSSKNKSQILKILFLLLMVVFSVISWLVLNRQFVKKNYSIFVEFDNAHGLKSGSLVKLRGLVIGSVIEVSNELNSVLALVKVNSSQMVIPKNVLIETNQTGLLNDTVIDIIPLELVSYPFGTVLDPLSETCNDKHILCHLSYVQGDRGLNYDDLIRATTRISQRFDDPRFFNLFYMLLQNSVELTDYIVHNLVDISNLLNIFLKRYIK